MKILIQCIECSQTKGLPFFNPFEAPYFEERISYATCENGHRIAVVLKAQKFEVLLEPGANALLADFTLEACASYSAALERFFEFSSKVMLIHLKMNVQSYDSLFKEMSRQSERQLGAFLVLHGLVFGESYKPNQKLVEFRNAVIHKGKIPTPEEAKNFCGLVYAEIAKVSCLLKAHCEPSIQQVLQHDFLSRLTQVSKDSRVFSSYKSSIFSMESDNNRKTFSEALDNFVSFNATVRHANESMLMALKMLTEQVPDFEKKMDEMRPK